MERKRRDRERHVRYEHEQEVEKRFENDFSFVLRELSERDLMLYKEMEKANVRILNLITEKASQCLGEDKYYVHCTMKLLHTAKERVGHSVRMQSRLREGRRNEWGGLIHPTTVLFDIYNTHCDCHSCARDF
jgi:hypothetical protein